MKLIQPLLIVLVVVFGLIYMARFRSRLRDRVLVILMAALGVLLVALPTLSSTIAGFMGVGRGVDLVLYLGLSGMAFVCLMMYGRLRELQAQMTKLARTVALNTARGPVAAAETEDLALPDEER